MTGENIAIIDMGTNTFHLMLVNLAPNGYTIIKMRKIAVRLGKGGIQDREITKEAEERAMEAIALFQNQITAYHCTNIHAYGTSAFRNAKNGSALSSKIHDKFGFQIHIIDGREEARLIYEGCKKAVKISKKPVLIMDIGGGSVEFIIADKDKILWEDSFEIGAQRLLDMFHLDDPISTVNIERLSKYLKTALVPLLTQVKRYHPKRLIGCAGSFNSLKNIYKIINEDYNGGFSPQYDLPMSAFKSILNDLVIKDRKGRLAVAGMKTLRVEMIVVALLLIDHVIASCEIETISISAYALKEGILFSVIEQLERQNL